MPGGDLATLRPNSQKQKQEDLLSHGRLLIFPYVALSYISLNKHSRDLECRPIKGLVDAAPAADEPIPFLASGVQIEITRKKKERKKKEKGKYKISRNSSCVSASVLMRSFRISPTYSNIWLTIGMSPPGTKLIQCSQMNRSFEIMVPWNSQKFSKNWDLEPSFPQFWGFGHGSFLFFFFFFFFFFLLLFLIFGVFFIKKMTWHSNTQVPRYVAPTCKDDVAFH